MGVGGGRTVAGVSDRSASGDRGYDTRGIDFSHNVVSAVGNEEVSRGIDGDAGGIIEFGARGRAAVTAIAGGRVARHGRDDVRRRVHLADNVVAAVGDEKVPCGVDREAGRIIQFGARGGIAVATISLVPLPANAVITPVDRSTWRTTLLPLSATKRFPAVSRARPVGMLSSAEVAAWPSPLYPNVPQPATVVITPVPRSTLRTTLFPLSAMKRSPAASTATPVGSSSSADVAAPPLPL